MKERSALEKTHRLRIVFVAFISVLVFGVIEWRLYTVQIVRHDFYTTQAERIHNKSVKLMARRGDILDRHGQILATSTFYDSVYYNPKMAKGKLPPELAPRLAELLDRLEPEVEALLAKKRVVPIRRKMAPDLAAAIRALDEELKLPPGTFDWVKESKRLYPKGALAGPVIGFAGIDATGDNVGREGLEKQFDDVLKGKEAKERVLVNSWRQGIAPMDETAVKSTFGHGLVLTLDSQIQHYAQKALNRRVGEVQAKGGVAIVMEVATGEILALASCPDFDPGNIARVRPEQMRNRALTDTIEIGSVMKVLTSTILIDNGLLSPDELIDCENGDAVIEGRRITDSHRLGIVPFRTAFAESSNVAAAKLGLRLEPNLYHRSLAAFGIGSRLGIDLPGENRGILYPVSRWTKDTRTSLPIGYETTLTALQVVTAVAAIGNGGMRMRPLIVKRIVSADGRLVEDFPPTEVQRVASPETCDTILELMELVVQEGTGKQARLPGYRVGAKTGTSKKHPKKRIYVASIVGLLPISDPKIAIYVYVDEPDPKIQFYGGHVAGPIFAEIARNAVRILGIPPDFPREKESADRRARLLAGAGGERRARRGGIESENVDFVEPTPGDAGSSTGPDAAAAWESNSGKGRKRTRAKVVTGRMPDCLGLTIPQVIARVALAEVDTKFLGTGIAVSQSPPPGARLGEEGAAKVIFASPSEARTKLRPRNLRAGSSVKGTPALPSEPGD